MKYFFYIGNAYPHKNLSRLIGALVIFNQQSNEKVVLKIGSARNVFIERLKKIIKKYGAQQYIKLLGFVPTEDKASLYKNSLAFVFPTLAEGFGLPGLEAMENGTLVLASDIPVLKEVFKGNVIYFDPNDPKSIAFAMEQAASMKASERKTRIEKAMKFAKRYSWAKMARETLEVYKEAVKSAQ